MKRKLNTTLSDDVDGLLSGLNKGKNGADDWRGATKARRDLAVSAFIESAATRPRVSTTHIPEHDRSAVSFWKDGRDQSFYR